MSQCLTARLFCRLIFPAFDLYLWIDPDSLFEQGDAICSLPQGVAHFLALFFALYPIASILHIITLY